MADILLIHPNLTTTRLSIPEDRLYKPLYWEEREDNWGKGFYILHYEPPNKKRYHVYEPVMLTSGGLAPKGYHVYLRQEDLDAT